MLSDFSNQVILQLLEGNSLAYPPQASLRLFHLSQRPPGHIICTKSPESHPATKCLCQNCHDSQYPFFGGHIVTGNNCVNLGLGSANSAIGRALITPSEHIFSFHFSDHLKGSSCISWIIASPVFSSAAFGLKTHLCRRFRQNNRNHHQKC